MSTVGPVKAALFELWRAVFNPAEVQVTYGARVTTSGPVRLAVGDVEGDSAPEALGPQRQMQEVYDIRCVLSATSNGSVEDQQRVTELVLELFDAAELAVRGSESQTLGVPGVILATVEGSWSLKEAEASETGGPINTSYEFRVHVTARYRLS